MAKKTTTRKKRAGTKRFVKAKHAPGMKPRASKAGAPEKRADFNQPGSVAIDRLPEPKRTVARAANALIRRLVPGCACVVKWGNAVYSVGEGEDRVAFASLMETKAGVNLALPGATLADPDGLLEGTGKMMRHVKLKDAESVERPGVGKLIRAASKVGLKGM